MHSRIHCILYDWVAKSFISMATNALWSVITLTWWMRQKWWNISMVWGMPNAFHSMLLYLVSALSRFLPVNAIRYSTVVLGASSHGNNKLFLTCKWAAQNPTLIVGVSKYSVLFHCRTSRMHHPSWLPLLFDITLGTCYSIANLYMLIQSLQ